MDYRARVLDLLSKFQWHDQIVECLAPLYDQGLGRYAIVSVNRDGEHWIDGFADSWDRAAEIVSDIDPEWTFCGVFDLFGEPGQDIETVRVHVVHEVGDGTGTPGTSREVKPEQWGSKVGAYDTEWAKTVLEMEE